ncbi:MAG: RNA-binding protein [Bacteroidetes bacterium]|nr:RNA-binding protein [Bacteroidota bacterium]
MRCHVASAFHPGTNVWGAIILTFALASCQKPAETAQAPSPVSEKPLFRLVAAEESNIHFANPLDENSEMNIFLYDNYYSGAGVAVGDLNGDSLPDLFFTANLLPGRLFFNQGNLRFQEATREAGLLYPKGWTTGCSMADVNGDGHLDLYICRSGKFAEDQRRNLLYLNNGNGTFTEAGKAWGLDDPGYSMNAVFFDYDNDGDLDCYLINYPIEAFKNFYVEEIRRQRDPLAGDKLFRNDGNRFTDVSAQAGINGSPISFSLSASVSDFNLDGHLDLYISTDFTEQDFYYLNNGNGTFRESLNNAFGHTSQFSMGNDAQDINRDGWQDLVVLDMLPEDNMRQKTLLGPNGYDRYQLQVEFGFGRQQMRNSLQLNDGNGQFREVGQWAGISNTDWSWCALLADYDNDGWTDLYVTNGFKRDYTNLDFLKYTAPENKEAAQKLGQEQDLGQLVRQLPSVRIPNYAFRNTGNGRFEKVSKAWGVQYPSFSNGAVYADLDRDGDLDLVVNNIDDKAFLFENQGRSGQHWLQVRLEGTPQNRFGVGARVRVETASGTQEQFMMPSRGFLSSLEPVLHFGLGADQQVQRVSVRWPDGKVQVISDQSADRRMTLKHAQAGAGTWAALRPEPLFRAGPAPAFTHRESDYIDLKTEPLLPHFCSTQGPVLAVSAPEGGGQADRIFVGSAKGFPAAVFQVASNGSLQAQAQPALARDAASEDGGAVWLDVNQDGFQDLYVASGSYEDVPGDAALVDRLYLGNAQGQLTPSGQDLSFTGAAAGSAPAAGDMNKDGFPELFVGSRALPGQYGIPAKSWLLVNEKGVLRAAELPAQPGGLVTAALWADLNGDSWPDLVVAGEWMPVVVYYNQQGKLQAPTALPGGSGWWYSLQAVDLDGDGKLDLVAGNRGWNAQAQASADQPVRMYVHDFDQNGQTEPIITYYIDNISYPMASRDDLLDQLNVLKKKYIRYAPYGSATYEAIFTETERKDAREYRAENFSSTVFYNTGNNAFSAVALPAEAQVAPMWGIAPRDLNGDGLADLVLTGNFFDNRAEAGPYDANRGTVLMQEKDRGWRALSPAQSGLNLRGDTRACVFIGNTLVVLNNRGPLQCFQYAKPQL